MKRIWTILVSGFGLLMLIFTLGFGPSLFPGHDPNPRFVFSEPGKRLAKTQAKVVTSDVRAAPEKTWRNYVSEFFMLEPTTMTSVPAPERTQLQELRARAAGAPRPGEMAVIRTDR